MLAFLLFVAAAVCFGLIVLSVSASVSLIGLGLLFTAAGLAVGCFPGWPQAPR